uniref:Uncharacterized protein n=1 Tax=Meloidogyne enterolobii TaxID=390850 RepID=A0A6V7TVF8_MELEN|nr:unnamed protein product [Meloidogyne enterolobii]
MLKVFKIVSHDNHDVLSVWTIISVRMVSHSVLIQSLLSVRDWT